MTLDISFTRHDYTRLCVVSLILLAINLAYLVYKRKGNLMELTVATLAAEVFIFCMWLAVCGLNNL